MTATTTLEDLRERPHLSVAQLKLFLACPRKYFLQYIERAEPAFRASALAFGSAWHATIDDYFRQGPPVRVLQRQFATALQNELRRDGPPVLFEEGESLDRLVTLGERMLVAFTAALPRPERVLGVEVPFALDLIDPDTGEVLPVPLVGAMDAVVVEESAPVVVELKSGKRRWSAEQLEYDLQVTAYAQAAHELVEGAPVKLVVTTKSSKPDVQKETLVRGPNDFADLARTASSVLRAVHAGVDHPVRSWACKSCPYAGACR